MTLKRHDILSSVCSDHRYQNGIKMKRCLNFECLYYISIKWLPVRLMHNNDFSAVNMTFISYSIITIATDFLAMQGARAHFSCGPFYWHGLTLIPAWISNHMPSKVWGEITYPFPNFNGCTVEVWEWINHFTFYNGCNYASVLGLKLIYVSKRGTGIFLPQHQKGWFLRLFFILSTCILVCFSEHWYSYPQDVLCFTQPSMQAVVTVTVSLYWMG